MSDGGELARAVLGLFFSGVVLLMIAPTLNPLSMYNLSFWGVLMIVLAVVMVILAAVALISRLV